MKCSKCGEEFDEDSAFCPQCGEKVGAEKNFCPDCGSQIDGDKKFCPFCGCKLENKASKPINESKNKINFPLDNKLVILIIAIIAVLGIGLLVASSFGSEDLIDVTDISMHVSYSDTPFGGALASAAAESGENVNYTDYQVMDAVTEFSLMPKESITRVTGLQLANIVVTFENGGSENWGSFNYDPDNVYYEDDVYDFQFTKTLEDSDKTIDEYYSISHISADIVINTTDETNKVVGHLNEDITPTHY